MRLFSIRTRLLGTLLLLIGTTGGTATLVGVRMIGQRFVSQAQAKVTQDIHSARIILDHEGERVRDAVRLTAIRYSLRDAVATRDPALAVRTLQDVRRSEQLDVLTFTDPAGIVIARSRPEGIRGDSLASVQVVRRAIETEREAFSVEALPPALLAAESPALASRARVALVATPRASPSDAARLDSGMVLLAAAPVFDEAGAMLGVVCGGRLLNYANDLVDRILDTLYRGETWDGRGLGTATLFLGDVRVATSARTESGERAIGTRIHAEVGQRVLREWLPWTERAFVVNGWYLTAYEPLRNLGGDIVGALYVGLREDRFVALQRAAVMAFLALTLGAMVLAAGIGLVVARTVLRPVHALAAASREIGAGNFDCHVPETSADELGSLERAFNSMAAGVRERDRRLRESAAHERATAAELREANARLTQFDKVKSEYVQKAVHDLRAPLSAILMCLQNVTEGLVGPLPAAQRDVLDRALRRADAMERLISDLLHLERLRTAAAPERAPIDVASMLSAAADAARSRAVRKNIAVSVEVPRGLAPIAGEAEALQSVASNLLDNAVKYTPEGGRVDVYAHESGDFVVFEVRDTGIGIPQAEMPRLFEEFFRASNARAVEREGTGLGLVIVRRIVEAHGGNLTVESMPGTGTTVTVRLPAGAPATTRARRAAAV